MKTKLGATLALVLLFLVYFTKTRFSGENIRYTHPIVIENLRTFSVLMELFYKTHNRYPSSSEVSELRIDERVHYTEIDDIWESYEYRVNQKLHKFIFLNRDVSGSRYVYFVDESKELFICEDYLTWEYIDQVAWEKEGIDRIQGRKLPSEIKWKFPRTREDRYFSWTKEILRPTKRLTEDIDEENLWGSKFIGTDLAGFDFVGLCLRATDFTGANLKAADLSETDMIYADLTGANLENAYLEGALLSTTKLGGVNFKNASLTNSLLYDAHLYAASFENSNLQKCDFYGAYLTAANFSGANLNEANLDSTNITPKQLMQCKSIENVKAVSQHLLNKVRETKPEMVEWWNGGKWNREMEAYVKNKE